MFNILNNGTTGGAGEVKTIGETAVPANLKNLTEIMTNLRLLHVECAEAFNARSIYDTRSQCV